MGAPAKGGRGDELPTELATVEGRRAKLQQARPALEAERRQAAEKAASRARRGRRQAAQQTEKRRWKRAKNKQPAPKARYKFVDPDSRITKDSEANAFGQGYNAQVAVDGQAQVIVAAAVTPQVNDRDQLLPMLE